MASSSTPYGLMPVHKRGYTLDQGGTSRAFAITSDKTAIVVGQFALLNSAGEILTAQASPNLASTTRLIGVVTGIEFVPPGGLVGRVQDSYLPANATTAGYTQITVFVNDDPDQLYMIQADGTLTNASALGKNAELSNATAISTIYKSSNCTLKASTIGTATSSGTAGTQYCMRIVNVIDSGAAFPDVVVQIFPGLHAYDQPTGATTTS